ncbi:MAG: hypothetical protein EHM45_24665 [Desulfobacteraceae bacterium]|nr:MAG: hypothetical protein EHM45_24665 [Desulfobacteraceae bacterium]
MNTIQKLIILMAVIGIFFIAPVALADPDIEPQYQDPGSPGSWPSPGPGYFGGGSYSSCEPAEGFECTMPNGTTGMLACQTCRLYRQYWYGWTYVGTERYCEECHQ